MTERRIRETERVGQGGGRRNDYLGFQGSVVKGLHGRLAGRCGQNRSNNDKKKKPFFVALGGDEEVNQTLQPFSIPISSAFPILWPDSPKARFSWGSEVGGGMRIAGRRLGRELQLLMVQDGSVAACATQPSLPWRGVGVETCSQSLLIF